jgi:hypothetical protein
MKIDSILACEDMRLANEMKAWRLEWATWLYCIALALLILPVAAAGIRM